MDLNPAAAATCEEEVFLWQDPSGGDGIGAVDGPITPEDHESEC
jgi:hypothetical protein